VSAFLEGNSKKALDAAWMVSRKADRKYINENLTVQHYSIIPYYVMVHLGKWDDILQLKHPGENLKYPAAIWHYARGMAQAAKGNLQAAGIELAAIKTFAVDESMKSMLIWDMNSAHDLVNIAANVLEGEILYYKKQIAEGREKFYKAIAIEDQLLYTEPPDWFFSVRHTLGHWLVATGQYKEAEKVYRDDLLTFKENGWALMGLYNSLKGQERNGEAMEVKKRFDKAWMYADVEITTSRILR
jgi:tetratricopeptide (TPR) repeat protein